MRTITLKELIQKFNKRIFDFEYDLTEDQKDIFERQFLRKYWFRNIGFETFEMFEWELQSLLEEKAGRYSRLATILDGVELELERNFKRTESVEGEGTNISDSESETDGNNIAYNQELGYESQIDLSLNNVNNAVRAIDKVISGNKNIGDSTYRELREITEGNIPLYEAIENLKRIKKNVLSELVDECNELFSMIYY